MKEAESEFQVREKTQLLLLLGFQTPFKDPPFRHFPKLVIRTSVWQYRIYSGAQHDAGDQCQTIYSGLC